MNKTLIIELITKMQLGRYSELTEKQEANLDALCTKLEGKPTQHWKPAELKKWVGFWSYSTITYSEAYEAEGFQGWLKHWRAKLIEVCKSKSDNISLVMDVAKMLDEDERVPEVKKIKLMIVAMVKHLGFDSLRCIGI